MIKTILFPSSFFNSKKVDEDLQAEYDAVIATGLFDVIIFGYEKWFNQGKLVLNKIPAEMTKVVYRGWMMKPEEYESFYKKLEDNNIELATSPKEYELMHIFPNVYEYVKEDTAKMEIFKLHERISVEHLKESFDRFMVKDYVKSVKGTEFPRYFDAKVLKQDEFDSWMEVFYKYRGDLLTGGICIKEYLSFRREDGNTNEHRVFYVNNKPLTISRNSGQGIDSKMPPQELVDKYANLNSCYYTVDYAELVDGSWRIIEAGDGSVSGLSDNQDYTDYYKKLYEAFNKKRMGEKYD